eukprot:gene2279-biopygen7362
MRVQLRARMRARMPYCGDCGVRTTLPRVGHGSPHAVRRRGGDAAARGVSGAAARLARFAAIDPAARPTPFGGVVQNTTQASRWECRLWQTPCPPELPHRARRGGRARGTRRGPRATSLSAPPPFRNTVPRGPNPVPRGPNPVPRGPNPVPRGRNPLPRGPNPVPRGRNPVPRGPNPVPRGPNPVPRGPNPVPRGPNPVPREPNPVPRGPNPVPPEPGRHARHLYNLVHFGTPK